MKFSHLKPMLLFVVVFLLAPAVWASQGKDVAYSSGEETVHGLLFTPPGEGPFPGLLAIHASFGLDEWTKEQASKLADAGYVVLALDLYRGKVAKTLDEATQIFRPIPVARRQRDVLAAMAFLRAQPNVSKERVSSIGWCMGGTWAFQLATLDPLLKVAVIRYGHVSADPALLAKIHARVLGIFGAKDTSIPVAEIRSFEQQMKNLNKPAEIVIYPEAGHAFEYPESTAKALGLVEKPGSTGSAYHGPRSDDTADAWKRTLDFLDTNLKSEQHVADSSKPTVEMSAAEQAVWEREEAYWHFLKVDDWEGYLRLWDERFAGWPLVVSAPVYIDTIRTRGGYFKNRKMLDYKLEPLSVREYSGNVVITFYRLSAHSTDKNGKDEQVITSRVTHTWMKTPQGWQIIGGMSCEDKTKVSSQ